MQVFVCVCGIVQSLRPDPRKSRKRGAERLNPDATDFKGQQDTSVKLPVSGAREPDERVRREQRRRTRGSRQGSRPERPPMLRVTGRDPSTHCELVSHAYTTIIHININSYS